MKWCIYNLGWENVLCHDLQEPYTQCIGLSDPAPHDCTSWVSDELVLMQLLNLVQLQRLSHTFFFGPAIQENFFPHADLPCSPNYPIKKKNSHLPHSFTYVMDFFFKTLFLFAVLSLLLPQIERMVPSLVATVDVQRRTRSCCNFKV
jgi:hypothetical protein